MPGDRFPFAVRVAREKHAVGFFCSLLQFLDQRAFATDIDIFYCKIVVHIDAKLALWKIPHMPHRGRHGIILAKIALDGLRFCGRFYNN